MKLETIGTSVPRLDALAKVTGKARYAEDFKEQGLLHAKVLRSPYAHARIVRIDTSRARSLPGVRAVITGTDLPDRRVGILVLDQHPIARQTVRYVGEPVAAVAADTPEAAEDALEHIGVTYEERQAIFDMEDAFRPDCPVVLHPGLADYPRAGVTGIRPPEGQRGNIFFKWDIKNGSVDKGFRESDVVVENRYSVQRINHACLETHMAEAWIDSEEILTIRSTRHGPGLGKPQLCQFFSLSPSRVRMLEPYIGGSFGGKADLWIELIAAKLAQLTGKPVRITLDREEVFKTVSRGNFVIYVKDGVKRDGTLIARQMRVLIGSGAYSQISSAIVRNSGFAAVGTYRIPNFKWESYGVYTNLSPSTAFRGFGAPEVQFAIEQQMDRLAERLGMDPVEFRLKNMLQEGDVNAQGQPTTNMGAGECLARALRSASREKPASVEAWRRGRGVAVSNKYVVAATTSCVRVKVHPDRRLEVHHGLDEIGQGINTVVAQVAAEEFGIPVEDVKVAWGDTATMPCDWASMASRSTWQLGHATRLACQDAKTRIFQLTAFRLEADPGELETRSWAVHVRGKPERAIPMNALFSPPGYVPGIGEIVGQGEYTEPKVPEDPVTGQSPKGAATYSYGACAIDLAVNVKTGEVRIEKVTAAYDMGQPVNPRMCEQQIEGGVAQAIGLTLYEELIIEGGSVLNGRFLDYKVPGPLELPWIGELECLLVPVPDPRGPYGAKSLGEGVLAPVAPAIVSAFHDATGIWVRDLPLTRERVWRLLRERAAKGERG